MNVRRRRLGIVVLAISLASCATSPIPEGYTGPRATIADFAHQETSARVQVFYVAAVNGKPIETSVAATRRTNAGRGVMAYFSATTISRAVPAGKTRLKLEGRIMYGAPIQEILMAATMHTADLEIDVDLAPGERYTVMGNLTGDNREIYLVDAKYRHVGVRVTK